MNTNQLPPLPTPKFTETIRGVPCITVTEHEHLMRVYALQARAQATQAGVTDEREAFESCTLMEGSLFKRRADDPDKYWDGNVQDDWELWQARAILALRPAAVPMDKQDAWDNSPVNSDWEAVDAYLQGIEDAEAHHFGTTAQAKKEGAA